MKPLLIKAKDLRPHPMLKRAGLLPDLIEREKKLGKQQGKSRKQHQECAQNLSDEFSALIDSILESGVREPLKVVRERGGWAIADGRHRWEAVREIIRYEFGTPEHQAMARRLDKEGLPCIEIAAEEAPAVILDATNRRHLSKGARAYLAVTVFPEVAKTSQGKRSDLTSALSAEVLARRVGVSPRLMEDAIALYKQFNTRKDLRTKFEPGIWVGEGLGAIKAGVADYLERGKSAGKETEDERKARLANQWVSTGLGYFNSLGRYWAEWERFDPEQEQVVLERAAEVFSGAPKSVKQAILKSLKS